MANRIGVELSPSACRIIEIGVVPGRNRESDTRVHAFAIRPYEGTSIEAALRRLRRRRVAVVAWGVPSDHRQVTVTAGPRDWMRAEAVRALAASGLQMRRMLVDVAPAGRGDRNAPRRTVVAVVAAADAVSQALAPLAVAGVRIEAVLTPAAALASIARMRHAAGVPGAIDAYVALDERATCIALTRDGVLLTSRELPWGFVDVSLGVAAPRPIDDVARRLGDALAEFFAAVGASSSAAGHICVCGGLSDLRSMTVRLTERLDVEVEPLDSLFGIDAAHLPSNPAAFRDRAAELRLAWAAAADWPPPLNLLRWRQLEARKAVLRRTAAAAAVVAVAGAAWQVARSVVSPSNQRRVVTSTVRPQPGSTPPFARVTTTVRPITTTIPPLIPTAPAFARVGPARATTSAPPIQSAQGVAARPVPTSASHGVPVPGTEPARPDTAIPFDAALGSILYSPNRKLAIVDGRIVTVGDDVRGARVIEITPDAVLLRDGQGRLRALSLNKAGR